MALWNLALWDLALWDSADCQNSIKVRARYEDTKVKSLVIRVVAMYWAIQGYR